MCRQAATKPFPSLPFPPLPSSSVQQHFEAIRVETNVRLPQAFSAKQRKLFHVLDLIRVTTAYPRSVKAYLRKKKLLKSRQPRS